MKTVFEGGTVLTLELDPSDGGYFSYISNTNWKSLIEKKSYTLNYILADKEWSDDTTEATKSDVGNIELLSAFDDEFGRQLISSPHLIVKYEGKVLETLSLRGTSKSLPAMVRCAQDEYRKAKIDPFAK